jgi:DNA-binding NtrC family response regulator/pSer/pThr/pTyr-binding forkhead associated (FHA) protein
MADHAGGEDLEVTSTGLSGARSPLTGSEHSYVVVFERHSSWAFALPNQGSFVIGRAESADIKLRDSFVSRQHAELRVDDGEVRIVDRGSQNGTFVNGERVGDSRLLVSGDVVTLCRTSIVFHSRVRVHLEGGATPLELPAFRRRAEDELERTLRHRRTAALVCVQVDAASPRQQSICEEATRLLSSADILGREGPDRLVILMPEVDSGSALAAARRLVDRLDGLGARPKVGFAVSPTDGCDVDTLLGAARTALQRSEGRSIVTAAETVRTLEIGGQRVLIADPTVEALYRLVERLAASDLPVLVTGETGSGKEIVASALHHLSPTRKNQRLLALNCAALQDTLVESELFGYQRGAFSGAIMAKPGLLESARGGTVFLDEIGELSAAAQAKLLRALDTKRITRIGEVEERPIDIRVVAATNRSLDEAVAAGQFRKDLLFRLSGAALWIPPLRDRQRELPLLAGHFLQQACAQAQREPLSLGDAAIHRLATHGWPGNVRELKLVMEYLAATVRGAVVEPHHLEGRLGPSARAQEPAPEPDRAPDGGAFRPLEEELRELEWRRISEALAASGGNKTRAAELIRMPLRTFREKLKQRERAGR